MTCWSQLSDSNRQPLDYKSRALPIEAKLAFLAAAEVCLIRERPQVGGGANRRLELGYRYEDRSAKRSETTGAPSGHGSGFSGRISKARAPGSY